MQAGIIQTVFNWNTNLKVLQLTLTRDKYKIKSSTAEIQTLSTVNLMILTYK